MSAAGNYTWPKRKKPVVEERPKRRYLRWVVGAVVVLLAGVGIAWAVGVFSTDPRLKEIGDLRAQMEDQNLTDEQRRALFGQFRDKMDALPENLRASMRGNRRGGFDDSRMMKHLSDLFAMSAADRDAALQKEVERQLEREKRDQERQATDNAASGQDSGNGNSKGSGGGPGGRRTQTDAQRTAGAQRRVENQSPQSRAAMGVYKQMVEQKAQQMGTPIKMSWGR
jgi:hypothetical protein